MLIYCDPPYQHTTGYSTGGFDHDKFWDTMRKWSKNNYIFISSIDDLHNKIGEFFYDTKLKKWNLKKLPILYIII